VTATETDVRKAARRLAGPSGDMDVLSRLAVMRNLLNSADRAARFGEVDRAALVRLAAHCIVWADQAERSRAGLE